jgi:hypothetical protein
MMGTLDVAAYDTSVAERLFGVSCWTDAPTYNTLTLQGAQITPLGVLFGVGKSVVCMLAEEINSRFDEAPDSWELAQRSNAVINHLFSWPTRDGEHQRISIHQVLARPPKRTPRVVPIAWKEAVANGPDHIGITVVATPDRVNRGAREWADIVTVSDIVTRHHVSLLRSRTTPALQLRMPVSANSIANAVELMSLVLRWVPCEQKANLIIIGNSYQRWTLGPPPHLERLDVDECFGPFIPM